MVGESHIDQLRRDLHARIKEASDARRASRSKPTSCAHVWHTFKQTVTVENDRFAGSAYFVVHGCTRCHAMNLLEYVVGGHR